ncbi:hypothetical protein JTB14_015055 [Gonioctena quinquepunctata]|nr:hypothetical protein JTB14_015055 [Gonioctena quinquepunctata]
MKAGILTGDIRQQQIKEDFPPQKIPKTSKPENNDGYKPPEKLLPKSHGKKNVKLALAIETHNRFDPIATSEASTQKTNQKKTRRRKTMKTKN